MINFLLSDINFAFTVCLFIVAGLALLEGVAVLVGASIMSMLDDMIDIDIDVDSDVSSSGLTSFLGWLCLNKLPMLVWLVLILTSFALTGISYNYFVVSQFNFEFLTWLSKPVALFGACVLTHYFGDAIAKVMPKNESSAVSAEGFAGKLATITIGTASKGNAAEAMLKDEFNQKHYVMVEPDNHDQQFQQGTTVVLMEKAANVWLADKLEK